MRDQLNAFDDLVRRYQSVSNNSASYIRDQILYDQLHRAEPTVVAILRVLDPALAQKINLDQIAGPAMARNEVQRALGILADMDEWAVRLEPDGPTMPADDLHPWVWQSAAPLWAAEARQDAILAAARTVNRRLQQTIDRHDIGETDLCLQTFDLKDAVLGKPRLRFPGERENPTWRARQEGAKYFGAGVFLAIRNIAAHDDDAQLSEQGGP